jgi:alpha-1,6-mannosyltransferase
MPHIARLFVPLTLLQGCWLALAIRLDMFVNFWAFQALFALAFALYLWALRLVVRDDDATVTLPTGRAAWATALLVLAPALVFRLTVVPAPIAFSDDIFRYVWNGRVSAADIDPYRYLVDDPALAPLRDESIWPNIGNRAQASPYPPLLEAWFALIYQMWPESLSAVKLAMSLLDMGVVVLLLLLLYLRGQPLARAAIYAWSPQAVFQVGFSGHNEPLLLFWLLAALAFVQPNARQTDGKPLLALSDATRRMLAGWALALATLAKLVPVLALPIMWRRWGWRATGVYVLTVGAVYGALLARGNRVFQGIAIETTVSQFNDGMYYLVYQIAERLDPGDPHALAQLAVRAILLGIIGYLFFQRGNDMTMPLGVILAAYVVLAASVAPWYVLWVLPFVCLDALPSPLRPRPYRARLFGGYWLLFSWTATFSELFYLGIYRVWLAARLLEYGLPTGNLLLNLWRSRRWNRDKVARWHDDTVTR